MKNTDKFLIGIVIGVIVLIGVAFAVVLWRPKPAYQAEDTPEGVAHNYLLALQQEDYSRAYSYLSPSLEGYPASADEFKEDIDRQGWQFHDLADGSTTLVIESSNQTGEQAEVSVQERHFYQGELFNSNQYNTTFDLNLRRDPEQGGWKITSADSYWLWCWNDKGSCN